MLSLTQIGLRISHVSIAPVRGYLTSLSSSALTQQGSSSLDKDAIVSSKARQAPVATMLAPAGKYTSPHPRALHHTHTCGDLSPHGSTASTWTTYSRASRFACYHTVNNITTYHINLFIIIINMNSIVPSRVLLLLVTLFHVI